MSFLWQMSDLAPTVESSITTTALCFCQDSNLRGTFQNTKYCHLAVQGVEPQEHGKEPCMLPLHHTAMSGIYF